MPGHFWVVFWSAAFLFAMVGIVVVEVAEREGSPGGTIRAELIGPAMLGLAAVVAGVVTFTQCLVAAC